jgi:hypothetical protein
MSKLVEFRGDINGLFWYADQDTKFLTKYGGTRKRLRFWGSCLHYVGNDEEEYCKKCSSSFKEYKTKWGSVSIYFKDNIGYTITKSDFNRVALPIIDKLDEYYLERSEEGKRIKEKHDPFIFMYDSKTAKSTLYSMKEPQYKPKPKCVEKRPERLYVYKRENEPYIGEMRVGSLDDKEYQRQLEEYEYDLNEDKVLLEQYYEEADYRFLKHIQFFFDRSGKEECSYIV